MDCMICGGPMVLIGTLGSRRWYRCRNCGIDDHEEIEQGENDETEGKSLQARGRRLWAP